MDNIFRNHNYKVRNNSSGEEFEIMGEGLSRIIDDRLKDKKPKYTILENLTEEAAKIGGENPPTGIPVNNNKSETQTTKPDGLDPDSAKKDAGSEKKK